MHFETLCEALPRNTMDFNVKNMSITDACCDPVADNSEMTPLMQAAVFTVQVIILNHSGQISGDYPCELECHIVHISRKFAKQWKKIDSCSGKKMKVGPNSWNLVVLLTLKWFLTKLCVLKISDYYPLGHFAVPDMMETVIMGIIMAVDTRGCKVTNSAQKTQIGWMNII